MKTPIRLLLALFGLSPLIAHAQTPTHKDVPYDDEHPTQILDVYLADSEAPAPVMVYIHGGGWRAGSKNRIPRYLAEANAAGWLAVVSVEYRFTNVAIHPAQVDDCARAIQFIRHHAGEWNLDPKRIGVTGGSAGGHLSAYVALQDDEQDPGADDPVSKLSSRVSFAIPFAGPTDWGLLGKVEHKHPAYRQLLGYKPGTPASEMSVDLKKDVSPLSFVSEDDPPILIVHGDADVVVPFEHAEVLETALKGAGVPVELYIVKGGNHGVSGGGESGSAKRATNYIRQQFLGDEPVGKP
tara:strand:+ start:7539 stop:8426 length:888 start_codon:yes stop_codon:yes gene_type:complete